MIVVLWLKYRSMIFLNEQDVHRIISRIVEIVNLKLVK